MSLARRSASVAGALFAAVALWPSPSSRASGPDHAPPKLKVMTFNVWHGLRSGESRKRFPGEDPERAERRFAWQIDEIRRLDPDVVLLQEVNPNQRQSRRYAKALGFDEIHKVTSCGIHLGKLYKIPSNVNEGLAILARPELDLRRVGHLRLSGNAWCTASLGFQTRESRYVLFGEIEVDGRPILLVTTHLSSPPFMPPGFEDDLDRLVQAGTVREEQRRDIVDELERKRARNAAEARRVVTAIERFRRRGGASTARRPVVLGGDFNTEPGTVGILTVENGGLINSSVGPDFLTWDPLTNRENHDIGAKRKPPVPTFGVPEIERLLAAREEIARQIDFVFVSPDLQVLEARRVLDRPTDGLYPSDHFAILTTLHVGETRGPDP